MKTKAIFFLLFTGVLGIFLSCTQANKSGGSEVSNLLSASQLESIISDKQDVVLIDVRTPKEISAGKIDGALEIDFRNDSFESEISKLNKDQAYVVYCRSGGRSAKSAKIMSKLGFKNVRDLDGGYTAWSKRK